MLKNINVMQYVFNKFSLQLCIIKHPQLNKSHKLSHHIYSLHKSYLKKNCSFRKHGNIMQDNQTYFIYIHK